MTTPQQTEQAQPAQPAQQKAQPAQQPQQESDVNLTNRSVLDTTEDVVETAFNVSMIAAITTACLRYILGK
jgi:hypothetical protein